MAGALLRPDQPWNINLLALGGALRARHRCAPPLRATAARHRCAPHRSIPSRRDLPPYQGDFLSQARDSAAELRARAPRSYNPAAAIVQALAAAFHGGHESRRIDLQHYTLRSERQSSYHPPHRTVP